jgi:hypothetical protein
MISIGERIDDCHQSRDDWRISLGSIYQIQHKNRWGVTYQDSPGLSSIAVVAICAAYRGVRGEISSRSMGALNS